jgi:hypothetical protein
LRGSYRQLWRKGRGEVVATGFDQNEVERGKLGAHFSDGGEVHGGVLANCRVRAAAGLDAGDALGWQGAGADQIFGVPARVDVVGDGSDVVVVAQTLAQCIH